MDITPYLPWMALGIAIIAILARDLAPSTNDPARPRPAVPYLMLAGLVAVVMALAITFQDRDPSVMSAGLGFSLGLAASAVSFGLGLMRYQSGAGRSAPFAVGVAMVAVLTKVPMEISPLAMIFGSAVGAWLLSFGLPEESNFWGTRTALGIALVASLNWLAPKEAPELGTMLGVVAGLALILSSISKSVSLRGVITAALIALGCWFVGDYVFKMPNLRYIGGGAALFAIIIHVVTKSDMLDRLRMILCAVIAVSAGTAAFSMNQGAGMALALLVLMVVLFCFQNDSGLLALGPLAGLVMYRLFREENLSATRSFEIGQHYVMIGMLFGIALPMLAQEWLSSSAGRTKFFGGLAGVLWVPVLVGVPIASAILLGGKGLVGFLYGLGFASVASPPKGERSIHTLTLSMGISAFITLIYPHTEAWLDLAKDEKVRYLGIILAGLLIVGVAIAVLSGSFKRSTLVGSAE